VLVTQSNITLLRFIDSIIIVNYIYSSSLRKGEELKAPRHASAAAIHNGNLPIFPILATLLLRLPSIYIYYSTSVININPPYLLLPL